MRTIGFVSCQQNAVTEHAVNELFLAAIAGTHM